MNDIEQDLRELFETKARDGGVEPTLAPTVLKRARSRQARTVLSSILGAIAILVGSIVGVSAIMSTDGTRGFRVVPALPDAPTGFDAVVLPYVTLAYPDGWSLVALDPASEEDRVLQLTNFDAGAARVDCEQGTSLLPGGVMLEVRLGAGEEPVPEWPTSLDVVPGDAAPCGADGLLGAAWTANRSTYSATALLAADATPDDVEAMRRAFETLAFPEAAPQTENLLGTGSLVLDSADSPVGPVVLYAYRDGCDGGRSCIGIAGPAGTRLLGAVSIGEVPAIGEAHVTMNLEPWGGIVWGTVAATVARAELRTVEGDTYPATLVPLPSSLGVEGHEAVWGVVSGATSDAVTTVVYDADGNVLNDLYPTGPRVTIASGTDPEGGPWELFLETTNQGTGLGFIFENGGGASWCCLQPLRVDLRLGWQSGGDGEPNAIVALASEVVTRVVFEGSSGAEIDGALYPVPDASLGIPQVAAVVVPPDLRLEGDLVAYDANGDEVARELVGVTGEPEGPTPEIDAVWSLLRDARNSIQQWAGRHDGSLETFTLEEARSAIPDVPWNASGAGKPVPYEVSIRGVAPAGGSEPAGWSGWNVVVVSTTPDVAHTYCIAVNIDEGGGGNFRYGTQDAASYQECRGGWPELE